VAGLLVPLASPALPLFAGGFPLAAAAGGALLLSRTRRR
jgi:hypothetical protein